MLLFLFYHFKRTRIFLRNSSDVHRTQNYKETLDNRENFQQPNNFMTCAKKRIKS